MNTAIPARFIEIKAEQQDYYINVDHILFIQPAQDGVNTTMKLVHPHNTSGATHQYVLHVEQSYASVKALIANV